MASYRALSWQLAGRLLMTTGLATALVLPASAALDVRVNDRGGDSGPSTTQSGTTIAWNSGTDTLCAAFNDSYHAVAAGAGIVGFARSRSGGLSWTDGGALAPETTGFPDLAVTQLGEQFFVAASVDTGAKLYRSDDDCASFVPVGPIHADPQAGPIRLVAAIAGSSPSLWDRLHAVWVDSASGRVVISFSDNDGGSWSTPTPLSDVGDEVGRPWPSVSQDRIVVAWIRWNPGPDHRFDIELARSPDQGLSWSRTTPPVVGAVEPSDAESSARCGQPALRGDLQYAPAPQIVAFGSQIHVVYSYDPDGAGTGDDVDVFYRRSVDDGASWQPEVRLNDDVGTTDQFSPSLSASSTAVVVAWQDRRNDPAQNLLIESYARTSFDGGASWPEPSLPLSDVASPVYHDPFLAPCYHGDSDQQVQTGENAVILWSDDREIVDGRHDADVFSDRLPVPYDFLVQVDPLRSAICAGDSPVFALDFPVYGGFSDPVTLSLAGDALPGSSPVFAVNPVMPPATSQLTIQNTAGLAAGRYQLKIYGLAPTSTHIGNALLDVATVAPTATPTLLAPPDNTVEQPTETALEWSQVAGDPDYLVELATDPGFVNVVTSEQQRERALTLHPKLAPETSYHWRVRATNACGVAPVSGSFAFQTERCAAGGRPVIAFEEGFESGAQGWTHSGTGDTWQASGTRFHQGSLSFWAENVPNVSDQRLVSPWIHLPTLWESPHLRFWNHQGIEASPNGECYDGAVVELSEDGSNWVTLEQQLRTDPTDGIVSNCCGNPLQGRKVWCGDPQDWVESVVDLDPWRGRTVKLRFRLATDASQPREGWYLDELSVAGCLPAAVIFFDGFER